jgi:hypothetical protein
MPARTTAGNVGSGFSSEAPFAIGLHFAFLVGSPLLSQCSLALFK